MERIISDEEKIRRAIEISQRRNQKIYDNQITRVNVNDKKDYRLLKKMLVQIVICLMIYGVFYSVHTTNYAFSNELVQSTQSILNYDVNLEEWYQKSFQFLSQFFNKEEKEQSAETINEEKAGQEEKKEDNTIIQDSNEQNKNNIENTSKENLKEEKNETISSQGNQESKNTKENAQMKKDAEIVKKLCKFKMPLKGKISSEFGDREITLQGMTADHKGIDIAANRGTSITAAMAGTVSVADSNSEYGKFIKIVNGDIMTVYAHCSSLKVKKGNKIKLGQTIAKVGSTGVSTGPHLHFEIRYKNRYINPRFIINF